MSTHDEIRLLGIGGYGYHGVLAREREEGQPFHADVTMYLDTAAAARTDDLDQTVSYAAVARAVQEVIEGEPANLIETVAARIADAVLAFGVAKVDVTVHKPQAPVGIPFTDVQVHVSRTAPTGAASGPAGPGLAELTESGPAEPESAAPAPVAEPAPAPAAALASTPAAALAPAAVVPPVPVPPAVPVPDLLADNEGVPGDGRDLAPSLLDVAPAEPVQVILGLGGNIGDVSQTFREAISDLDRTPGISVTGVAPLARTEAVTHDDAVVQDDYHNTIVRVDTTLSPRELLAAVHRVEDTHGRVRVERWGDRTLDIDIITYGEITSSAGDLTLPHPRASQRAFVLLPWAQLDPGAQLPGPDGGAVADLAERAPDRAGVRWLALDWFPEAPAGEQVEVSGVGGEDPADSPDLPPAEGAPAAPTPDLPPAAPTSAPSAAASAGIFSGFGGKTAENPGTREEEPAPAEDAPADDVPGEVAPVDDASADDAPPAPPIAPPPSEGPPAVADWLANEPQIEPEFSDAAPALPVPAPTPALPPPAVPTPTPAPPSPPTPAQESPASGGPAPEAAAAPQEPGRAREEEPAAVAWLEEDEPAAPLSATPQWQKIRRDE